MTVMPARSARRRIGILATTAAVTATVVLSGGSPAYATDTSYNVSYAHANGAGAVAVAAKGNIVWHAASVSVTNTQVYCAGNHYCTYRYVGWQGDNPTPINSVEYSFDNTNFSSGSWTSFGDSLIDARGVRGGITKLKITVVDITHGSSNMQTRIR